MVAAGWLVGGAGWWLIGWWWVVVSRSLVSIDGWLVVGGALEVYGLRFVGAAWTKQLGWWWLVLDR